MSKISKQNLRLLGTAAAVIILVSLLLPWMVINAEALGIPSSEDYTGIEIIENGDENERFYPIIAAAAAVLAIVVFQMALPSSTRMPLALLLGAATIASVFLVLNHFQDFEVHTLLLEITVSLSYGAYLAIIGGLGVAAAGFLETR